MGRATASGRSAVADGDTAPLLKGGRPRLRGGRLVCGGLGRIGRPGHVALAGAKVNDRVGNDVVGADLCAVAIVFAAAQFAFDADMRALLEGGGVFPGRPQAWMRCHSVPSRLWPSFI